MDLPYGDTRNAKFITGVGLITTTGPHGPNIMSSEGTHLVSYQPGLVTISIGNGKPTWENLKATKEFGISLASEGQEQVVLVSGRNSGKNVNKIAVLKDLGIKFSNAKHIKAQLVDGAALHIEAKIIAEHLVGDHTIFVGQVLEATEFNKKPLAYHQGQLLRVSPVAWPAMPEELVKKHAKK